MKDSLRLSSWKILNCLPGILENPGFPGGLPKFSGRNSRFLSFLLGSRFNIWMLRIRKTLLHKNLNYVPVNRKSVFFSRKESKLKNSINFSSFHQVWQFMIKCQYLLIQPYRKCFDSNYWNIISVAIGFYLNDNRIRSQTNRSYIFQTGEFFNLLLMVSCSKVTFFIKNFFHFSIF